MGCEEVATVAGEEGWGRYEEVLPGSGIAIGICCHTPIELRSLMKRYIDRWIRQTSTHSGGGERTGSQFLKEWNDRSIERDCLLYYYDLWIHLPNPCHKQKKKKYYDTIKNKNKETTQTVIQGGRRRSGEKKQIKTLRFRGKSKTCLAFYLAYANFGSVIYL